MAFQHYSINAMTLLITQMVQQPWDGGETGYWVALDFRLYAAPDANI